MSRCSCPPKKPHWQCGPRHIICEASKAGMACKAVLLKEGPSAARKPFSDKAKAGSCRPQLMLAPSALLGKKCAGEAYNNTP